MACELTQGYSVDCADYIGGAQAVYISNFDNVASYAATGGELTALTQEAATNFYVYNLEKENCTTTETQTKSIENGTNMYEGELSFTIKKLLAAQRDEIRLLALSRLFIIVKDNNGKFFTFGADFGADLTTSTASTGQAFGDLNGYALTFSSKERLPMFEVPQAVIDTLSVA